MKVTSVKAVIEADHEWPLTNGAKRKTWCPEATWLYYK